MKHTQPEYAHIQDQMGVIPDGEPVFILRASAPGAAYLMNLYGCMHATMGTSLAQVGQVLQAKQEFESWCHAKGLEQFDGDPRDDLK